MLRAGLRGSSQTATCRNFTIDAQALAELVPTKMLSLPLCACLARAYSSLTPVEPGGAPQSARAHTSYSQTPPSTSEKVTSLEFLLDAGMTFSAARRLLRKRQVRVGCRAQFGVGR